MRVLVEVEGTTTVDVLVEIWGGAVTVRKTVSLSWEVLSKITSEARCDVVVRVLVMGTGKGMFCVEISWSSAGALNVVVTVLTAVIVDVSIEVMVGAGGH